MDIPRLAAKQESFSMKIALPPSKADHQNRLSQKMIAILGVKGDTPHIQINGSYCFPRGLFPSFCKILRLPRHHFTTER